MAENASPANPAAQRWGLLIGINEYPRLPKRDHLKGCINDVNAIEELLTSRRFSFPPDHILKLTSPAPDASRLATRQNILDAFRRHLVENERIREGDVIVIYYCGHGSQIPDEEGDEEDGFDETIVPCDGGPDRSKREDVLDISDDEISRMLDQLAERTKNINLIFDSCHSGTITRAILDAEGRDALGKERYLPPATYSITQPPLKSKSQMTRSMGPSDWMPLSDGYVLISACMAAERAREDGFKFWRRRQHGVMTYYLLEAMKGVGPETTYLDIWDDVRLKVNKHNRWQNPQIEGAFERKVFGGASLPRRRYVEVVGKGTASLTLAAGLANGATAGSRFAVYPPGTQSFDDRSSRLAVVKLTHVYAFNSTGKIEEGALEKIEAGAPAIEIEHDYGEMRMRVDVAADELPLNAVRERVSNSNLLRLSESQEASPTTRVLLRYPYDENGNEVEADGKKIFVVSAGDGHPLVEPIAPDENGPAIVLQKLEHIAAYYNVLAIRNPDQQSSLQDKVNLRLLRVTGEDEYNRDLVEPIERSAGGDIILRFGEKVVIEAENLSNQPLHFIILDFDTSWGVAPIFPEAGVEDSMVRAGATRRISRFRVDLPKHQNPVKEKHPLPREIIKAIATTARVEFRNLWQKSTRTFEEEGASSEEGTSLYSLMERAVGITQAHVTRSLEKDDDLVVRDWTTAEIAFYITT